MVTNPNQIKEEDHATIVGTLKQYYSLLLMHDEFKKRLAKGDEPSWIDCFNYLIELGVVDEEAVRIFRAIEAIYYKFQDLYNEIDPKLKEKVEQLVHSLQNADSAADILRRLEKMSNDPIVITAGENRKLLRDTIRSAQRIITHSRVLYDNSDVDSPIPFSSDEKLSLLKKDVGGAISGGATGVLTGAIMGVGIGGVVGVIVGATVGAIASSAGEATETSFGKLLNIFRRKK